MGKAALIAGNWKMFHGVSATGKFLAELETGVSKNPTLKLALGEGRVELAIFPPFTSLWRAMEGKSFLPWLKVGAQNAHWASDGAFTGEVSPLMLKESGCDYVIIGHSERRHLFGESDEQIHQKTLSAVSCGLRVILCVGETLQERESGATLAVINQQMEKALVGLSPEDAGGAVSVAYEPVWAIGTGRTAHSNEAQEVCQAIRCFAAERFGEEAAASLRILYGGSVKPDNAAGLLSEPDIDGALVGGASLKVEPFLQILSAAI